jgi:ABC-type glycerol-3-phosphate transport system permease component
VATAERVLASGAATARARRRARRLILRAIVYVFLTAGTIVTIIPFVWMVSTSLKTPDQTFAFPPVWIPDPIKWDNYTEIFRRFPFGWAIFNSAKISVLSVLGTVLSASLAAFAFARLRFRGKEIWFSVFLATLMIPGPVTLIPVFLEFRALGWLDTHNPLIVPHFLGSAFGMFLLRQFFLTIPRDLDDAAKIDGASPPQIYARIYLPLSKAALATLAVFVFLATWNDLLGPAIYLQSPEKLTLALGLTYLRGQYNETLWNVLMAGGVYSLLPVLATYVFAQKYFVQGIALSGIKG